jgi:hypothetical protein
MTISVPKTLDKGGRALWIAVTGAMDFEDPREIHALKQACLIEDDIVRLRAQLSDSELVVQGSTGQPVESPLLASIRNATSLQAKLLSSIAVEESDIERSRAGRRLVAQRYV